MKKLIDNSWVPYLKSEFDSDYFKELEDFVDRELIDNVVFPKEEDIFKAFNLCHFEDLKVVIIGQDPYHGPNQAHGLCFSVNEGIKLPPSLKNIYKEMQREFGSDIPSSGNLEYLASQGVFLLNAILTVEHGKPASHHNQGWELFTDSVIKTISDQKEGLVFMLWGVYAQKKKSLIDINKHLVLESSHPSPFSVYRGFSDCDHFKMCNEYLLRKGKDSINWLN